MTATRQEIVPPPADNYSVHWGLLYRGQLMLRDDSAMNLSAEMFAEFVLPYDRQLLEKFGGGVIHACGHVDHFVRCFSDLPQLHGFNLTQPHLNDMERIYRQTLDRGIPLLGLPRQAAEEALRQERANLHLIHVA